LHLASSQEAADNACATPVAFEGTTTMRNPARLLGAPAAALLLVVLAGRATPAADEPSVKVTPQEVLDGLRAFWQKTARADGSFAPVSIPTTRACPTARSPTWRR
jgi:hypothetical protein